MEISDFIKILFGALVGFAGSWVQSRLRRDEQRLKLHREKLEEIYSLINSWSLDALDIHTRYKDYFLDKPQMDEIGTRVNNVKVSSDRIKALTRFYADGVLNQYNKCWESWVEFRKKKSSGPQMDTCYKNLTYRLSEFENAIVNESKKYISQSFMKSCKSLLPGKWKSPTQR